VAITSIPELYKFEMLRALLRGENTNNVSENQMKLTILGSGTGIPTKERSAAGYVITINEKNYVFDSGPGTIRRLCEAGIDPVSINHFFYTHLHLDHIADLFPILFANKNVFRNRSRAPIHLYGPKGFRNFYLTMAQAVENQILADNYRIYLRELSDERLEFSGWHITTCHVNHSKHSLAYRIDVANGGSLVYSGDTDVSENLIKLAHQCHVFILDCAFAEGLKKKGHLIPSEAGKMAATANCKKLILTHLYPPVDEDGILKTCQHFFDGEIIIAEDLMKIEI
jgi:ribonuclease BN (tRNA processing enzyme)